MEAGANRIELNVPRRNQRDDIVDPREQIFIHMELEYYPNGINHQQIRQAFDETCGSFSCGSTRAAQSTKYYCCLLTVEEPER